MYRGKIVLGVLFLLLVTTSCVKQTRTEENSETKIVVTSVAICEILDQIGVDEVVGVPETERELPSRYSGIQTIGSPMSPDMEMVQSIQPTIVLSPISLESELKKSYEAAGISYYFVDLSSVEGMYESIQYLGELFSKQSAAQQLIEEYEGWKNQIAEQLKGVEKKTVLILMGLPGSYVVATENSYVGNLVAHAGGINCYEGMSEDDFISVNTEDMLKKEPDLILRTSHALPEQVMAMFEEEFRSNDIWKHFKAVQEEKVYDLSSESFGMSANLQYKEAVEELQGYLK